MTDFTDLFFRFGLNLVALLILLFGLYYPRYSQKETAISAGLFNIFGFAVLSVLSSVQFSVAAGFGLFAILALFTLRSEPIGRSDIAYFFGSLSLAVITSIQDTHTSLVVVLLVLVLLAVYVIDHPNILRMANSMKITLDHIPQNLVADPQVLQEEFTRRLGVQVISVRIINIDYVNETVRAEISYRTL